MNNNQISNGFILEKKEIVKDIDSTVYMYYHEKSGAKLMYIDNGDMEKTFSIGFKTPPKNSTGVMHILEHSVLCGSKKFPTKEPFVELCKGSLNTFLNAMTYSDKTVYPIASMNEKDFYNLMNVYLDAVFYPQIYNEEKILKQEGWHYHIEDKPQDIEINGVVYNEMKGVYSSPTSLIFRKIQETLYPDNAYGHDSGGNPANITDLTYEEFINTHSELYHPSNGYITLTGNMDIEKTLKFLDEEYLCDFEKRQVNNDIPIQKAFKKRREFSYEYSVSDEEKIDSSDYLALNMVVGNVDDIELNLAFDILTSMLLHSEEAPLRQAILDANIGDDCFGISYSDIMQPYFSIIVKNSNKSKKEEFIGVVEKTLSELVKGGINKELIEGCINMCEFAYREGDSGSIPKGLNYSLDAMASWIHGKNPINKLRFEEHFKNIKRALKEPYFENIIEKYIVGNTHSSIITLEAKVDLTKIEENKMAERLKSFKNSLSEDELESLVKDTVSLCKYQESEDKEDDLKKIPMLSLDDIEREVQELKVDEYELDSVKVLHHNIFTGGIAYVDTKFNVESIKEDDIEYIGLLSDLLTRVGTSSRGAIELSNNIMKTTGGISVSTRIYGEKENHKEYIPRIEISCKMINSKTSDAIKLISEVCNETVFEDDKKIKEVIKERISEAEIGFMSKGHIIAISRMNSYYSPIDRFNQKVKGLEYYNFLKEIDKNIDENIVEIKTKLESVRKSIFNRNNLLITIIGSELEKELFFNEANYLIESLPSESCEKQKYTFNPSILNEGLMIPSKVQYIAKGYNYKDLGYEYHGSMEVLSNILRYGYLWNNIRVLGGAYGAMINIDMSGNFDLCSYRDPNVEKTINSYKALPEFLENIELSQRELEKAIIGTLSDVQLPSSPKALGKVAIDCAITRRSKNDRQKKRDEILNTNMNDLRNHAKMVKDVIDIDCQVAVGNEKLKASRTIFKDVYNVIK